VLFICGVKVEKEGRRKKKEKRNLMPDIVNSPDRSKLPCSADSGRICLRKKRAPLQKKIPTFLLGL
jgi:hypothetical protein